MKFYKATDGQIVINKAIAGEVIIPNTVEAAFEKQAWTVDEEDLRSTQECG